MKEETYFCDLCKLQVDLEKMKGWNVQIDYHKTNEPHAHHWVGIVCDDCGELPYKTVVQRLRDEMKEKTGVSSCETFKIYNFFPKRLPQH